MTNADFIVACFLVGASIEISRLFFLSVYRKWRSIIDARRKEADYRTRKAKFNRGLKYHKARYDVVNDWVHFPDGRRMDGNEFQKICL